MTDRNVGGLGVQIDAVPPQTFERQTDALAVMVDVSTPTGNITSNLATLVDLTPSSSARAAGLLVLIDYVPSFEPPPGELWPLVRWNEASDVFETTGSATPIHWQATGKTFQTALLDLPVVVWNGTALRFELPDSWEDLAYDGLGSMSYVGLEALPYGG